MLQNKQLYFFFKRTFDIIFSMLSLILLFPLVFLIALIQKLSSPGPIFFYQRRIGYNGRSISLFKFRTMNIDAENHDVWAQRNDPRVTKFGIFLRRTGFDELPLFLNVIKGDLSIIGPRPMLEFEHKKYPPEKKELLNEMLKIRPGITGWEQVCRYDKSNHKSRLEMDIEYKEKQSFLLDFKIILKTISHGL